MTVPSTLMVATNPMMVGTPQVQPHINQSNVNQHVDIEQKVDVTVHIQEPFSKHFDGKGSRVSKQLGSTALGNKKAIGVVYNAEPAAPTVCCTQMSMLFCCFYFNKERSYVYVRENSVETNTSWELCPASCALLPMCKPTDNVHVQYFDKLDHGRICCCLPWGSPKYEIVKPGCLCCCVHVNSPHDCGYPGMFPCLLEKEKAVMMPYERDFCCLNRVGPLDNCWGCCGAPTGNPKVFYAIGPIGSKDPYEFVQIANTALFADRKRRGVKTGIAAQNMRR